MTIRLYATLCVIILVMSLLQYRDHKVNIHKTGDTNYSAAVTLKMS